METRRLLQYISTLSEEDRKKYKPLIDDALRRDQRLAEAVFEAKRQVEMFEVNANRLRETTEQFNASISKLNAKLAGIAVMSETAFGALPHVAGGGVCSTLRH